MMRATLIFAFAAATFGFGYSVGHKDGLKSAAPVADAQPSFPFPFLILDGGRLGYVTSVTAAGYTTVVTDGKHGVRERHHTWRALLEEAAAR